jgi:hypothetical protein
MTFARNSRTDRRRRVIREAAAADTQFAIDSVRTRRRARLSVQNGEDNLTEEQGKRDPGYSQAVRRACQQRLVQLIPVRKRSVSLLVFFFVCLYCGLVAAHYVSHLSHQTSNASQASRPISVQASAPILYLFHLRSTHSIAHWLGTQLWMLTSSSG